MRLVYKATGLQTSDGQNKMNLLILKLVIFHRLKSRTLVYIRSKVMQMPNDILEAECSCKEISGKVDWTPPQKIIIHLSTQKADRIKAEQYETSEAI